MGYSFYTSVVYHTLIEGLEIIIINHCEVYGTFTGDGFIFESSYMIQNTFSQYLTERKAQFILSLTMNVLG